MSAQRVKSVRDVWIGVENASDPCVYSLHGPSLVSGDHEGIRRPSRSSAKMLLLCSEEDGSNAIIDCLVSLLHTFYGAEVRRRSPFPPLCHITGRVILQVSHQFHWLDQLSLK
jgi:hypothetical protein